MAVTISAVRRPKRITLGLADVITSVTLPKKARKFSVQPIANDAKIAWVGTDGQAIGSDFVTLQSDLITEIDVLDGVKQLDGGLTVYIASATGATVIEIMAEE